jgi:hypothetical protein
VLGNIVLRIGGASGVKEIVAPFDHQAGSRAPSPSRTLGSLRSGCTGGPS